jgi:hypothetical protein
MAFPAIQTGDTKNGTVVANSASWTLTYPTNLGVDELILAFAAIDGSGANFHTWPADWVIWYQTGTGVNAAVCFTAAVKKSLGTETGNFTLTLNNGSEQGGWRIFRITGWHGTLIAANGDPDSVSMSRVNGVGQTTGTTPNPPNLDPVNWATEDTLWIAGLAVDTSRTISVFPLADNNSSDVSGGAGGASLGLCTMNDAVSSKDPGTFTISASDDAISDTLAIRPAAAAAAFAPPVGQQGFDRDRYGLMRRASALRPKWKREHGIWLPDRSILLPT